MDPQVSFLIPRPSQARGSFPPNPLQAGLSDPPADIEKPGRWMAGAWITTYPHARQSTPRPRLIQPAIMTTPARAGACLSSGFVGRIWLDAALIRCFFCLLSA